MENQEVFQNEVVTLLSLLLQGNFIDKIAHLESRGFAKHTQHLLYQERYELYQDCFDELSEFMMTKYWEHMPALSFQTTLIEGPASESAHQLEKVLACIGLARDASKDSALNSLLDEFELKFLKLKYKMEG